MCQKRFSVCEKEKKNMDVKKVLTGKEDEEKRLLFHEKSLEIFCLTCWRTRNCEIERLGEFHSDAYVKKNVKQNNKET